MDKIDRISELPEFILHIILSILDTKEVFRASVLSKRWYRAWSSIPVLDFKHKYFKKVRDINSYTYDDYYDNDYCYDNDTVKQFLGFVNKTMQRYFKRKYRITKLDIMLPYVDEKIELLIDKWISIAVQNQIQELNINLLASRLTYALPEILFRAKSVKVLSCQNVVLRYYETMDLVSLEFLSFFLGKLDKDMLQKIISLSPLVKLWITTDWDLGKFSLPWSRKVNKGGECVGSGTMRYNLKTAPLKEFVYNGFGSTATWEWNMNMSALKNLRKLEIFGALITDDIVSEMAYGLVALESLELISCSKLKCVKISSISLKEFRIKEVPDEILLTKITIDTPNLLEFWCSCDVESYVLIRAQDHSNTCFLPPWVESITIFWFVKLKKFLIETNCFKSLVIDMGTFEKIDIDEDLLWRIGVTGSPYKLRELKLREKHDYFSNRSLHIEFLDALFLTCRPDVLSLSFQNIRPGDILGYLKRKVQCWKDPLKKVEVESVDCSNFLSKPAEVEFRFRLSWFSVES